MFRPRQPIAALVLMGLLLSATLAVQPLAHADMATLYVGGNTRAPGDGLSVLRFDPATGTLSEARLAAPIGNPDWLAMSSSGEFLYAAGTRDDKGGLSAFAVEKDGELREISALPGGERPVSLAIDATGRWLVGAYYGGGSWAIWPLAAGGQIGERRTLIEHQGSGPNQNRQQSPHPHQAMVAPDNGRIWIPDLGMDRSMIYDFDDRTGEAKPSSPAYAGVAPGSGPRHLAFGQKGRIVYVINELSNTISVFQGGRGIPGAIQTISTLPPNAEGTSTGAEIVLSPDGRFLYASNRGYDSLAQFAIERDGTLTRVGWTPVGKEPRHFTFDPSGQWVLVGNQRERSVSVFAFDKKSGALSFHSQSENVLNEPTCLVFGR